MRLNSVKVKFMLVERNMIQQDLADLTGISRGNLSSLLNGKKCRPMTAYKIAKGLNVDPESIIEEGGTR